jgi:uncharacterized protein
MPPEKDDKIAEILKPMLKKRLFVALSKAVARPEQMLPFVAEHLEYMNQLENKGKLFASGPFIQEGVLVGDGLTILQTSTLEEAHALMSAEPLIKRGLREFDLLGLVAGKPAVHVHGVVALPTGETRGGHMLEAYVWPTLELFLTAWPEPLVKVHDDETDLALFDLQAHA